MKGIYLLGIDIGTSACKVAVFDREGQVKAAATGDYPVYYPREGWVLYVRPSGKFLRKARSRRKRLQGSGSTARAGLPLPLIKRERY